MEAERQQHSSRPLIKIPKAEKEHAASREANAVGPVEADVPGCIGGGEALPLFTSAAHFACSCSPGAPDAAVDDM